MVMSKVIDTYVGVSTETKPTTGRDGSTFYETDAQRFHIWGGAAWTQLP